MSIGGLFTQLTSTELARRYRSGATLADLQQVTGLSREWIRQKLKFSGVVLRPTGPPSTYTPPMPSLQKRVFCDQCQRNRLRADAEACKWRFCKAGGVAA